MYDFDTPVDRHGTDSEKWDGCATRFGRPGLVPLWVADMDFAAPQAVVQALVERATHPVYGYTMVNDEVPYSLIDWLDQRFDWRPAPHNIVLAPGVVPSIHAAILAFTEPGESVIVQTPVYAPFMQAVHQLGRQVVENPLRLVCTAGRLHYEMDFANLEQLAAQGARLLLLCSPHNPVGRVWREDELREILRIARRHGLVVFADEIHADLVYPGERHLPIATLAQDADLWLSAVAPSKTFNMPGLGLSAVVVREPLLRDKLVRVFAQWHWTAGNPFSLAGWVAAYRHGSGWLDALLDYLQRNRDDAADFVNRHWPGVQAMVPQATVLMWLDCRQTGMTDAALRHWLVEQCGLALSPGILFGQGGSGFMRLNLATPRRALMQALAQVLEPKTSEGAR